MKPVALRLIRSESGFTLTESLVALVLTLVVTGAVFDVVNPNATLAHAQPEQVDMQQRARAAGDALLRDLLMAGAGFESGPQTGSLAHFFPPVLPRRIGLQGSDPFGAARADVVTITFVPTSFAQTTTRTPVLPASPLLEVTPHASCPAPQALCGLEAGETVLVFDRAGRFSLFELTSVLGGTGQLQALEPGGGSAYAAGAFVARAEVHTYYFDHAARQLRHYDGYLTDVPVVDNVVDVRFDYLGDPNPPTKPKPPLGQANCLYDAGGVSVGGLAIPAEGGSLAPLPLSVFTDGPWCGDGPNRFDADLLRIRKVRVSLRVQAVPDWARGANADYSVAGTSRSALAGVADYVVTFDVAPRNLNLGR